MRSSTPAASAVSISPRSKRQLVADQRPDVRLGDVQVGVERRVVVAADSQVAGARWRPVVRLRFVEQVVGLLQVRRAAGCGG